MRKIQNVLASCRSIMAANICHDFTLGKKKSYLGAVTLAQGRLHEGHP